LIFGLIDYYNYRTRRGRFSPPAMERGKWHRATLQSISDHTYLPGDMAIFSPSGSWMSWAIMYVTNSVASHAAVVADPSGRLVEATIEGVMTSHMWGHVDADGWFLSGSPTKLTDEERRTIVESATSMVETPYAWGALPRLFLRELSGLPYSHQSRRLQSDALLVLAAVFIVTGFVRRQQQPTHSRRWTRNS